MKKVLIFTDNELVYGGSERLLYNLVNNKIINKEYDLELMYTSYYNYGKLLNLDYTDSGFNKITKIFTCRSLDNFFKHSLKSFSRIISIFIRLPFMIAKRIGIISVIDFLILFVILLYKKPDIVHINNGGYPASQNCRLIAIACGILRIHCIMQVNNIATESHNIVVKVGNYLISHFVSYFVTASNQARETICKVLMLKENKALIIHNTIKKESISLQRDDILRIHSLPVDSYVLCNVAFFEERKGQKYIINSLFEIKQEYSKIYNKLYLVLVGSGPEINHCKQLARDKKVYDHIRFIGFVPDSVNYINACDLFIMSSTCNEDMPLVILTAMSLGKNIIGTSLAGIEEELFDNCGLIISKNKNELSDNITKGILKFYNQELDTSLNALSRYNKEFSNEIYGKCICSLYNLI